MRMLVEGVIRVRDGRFNSQTKFTDEFWPDSMTQPNKLIDLEKKSLLLQHVVRRSIPCRRTNARRISKLDAVH
jgi:hypothetical protein